MVLGDSSVDAAEVDPEVKLDEDDVVLVPLDAAVVLDVMSADDAALVVVGIVDDTLDEEDTTGAAELD